MREYPRRIGVRWDGMVEGGQGDLGFVAFACCFVVGSVSRVFGSTGKGCMLID